MMIFTPGKPGKFRPEPFGIPSMNNQLVQEVIRMIIEPIYELKFNNQPHGFRSGRSSYLALKWIKTNMTELNWFVGGKFKDYIYSIDNNILMKIIERNIQDDTILRLIRIFKDRVLKKEKMLNKPELGIAQEGILSSLLSNIYFNELDQYLENLSKEYKDKKIDKLKKNNSQIKPLPNIKIKNRLKLKTLIKKEISQGKNTK
jgi:retron-type reverse transcriptase